MKLSGKGVVVWIQATCEELDTFERDIGGCMSGTDQIMVDESALQDAVDSGSLSDKPLALAQQVLKIAREEEADDINIYC